jgi:flagellin
MRVESLSQLGVGAQQKTAVGAIEQTNKKLGSILEKLSTGQRINKAKDDAAGLAISEGLITQTRGFKMAMRNTEDGISALNIAEGASNETSAILNRQRELAVQARTATLTDNERGALDKEFQQLTKELDRISNVTNFNKQELINGKGLGEGDAQLQVGANAGEMLGVSGMDISVSAMGMGNESIGSVDGASSALSAIDNALSVVGQQRSDVGAMTNRLESTIRNLQTADVNTTAAQSIIRDQDMALGVAEMIKNQVLEKSGMNALSIFNKISADHILGLIR